jgi:hypothetical protein
MGSGKMVPLWLKGSSCLLYSVFQQGDRSLNQSDVALRRLINRRSGQIPGGRGKQGSTPLAPQLGISEKLSAQCGDRAGAAKGANRGSIRPKNLLKREPGGQ